MAVEREAHEFLFGHWLQCLYSFSLRPRPKMEFAAEAKAYLTGRIEFVDNAGEVVYLQVNHIEPLETREDLEFAFDFEISRRPPPPNHEPTIGKREGAPITSLMVPFGKTVQLPTIYGYTFTSLNTLEQNKEGLRDFVLIQLRYGEHDPLLDD